MAKRSHPVILGSLLLIILLVFSACGAPDNRAEIAVTRAPASIAAAPSSWDQLVRDAQKEGVVNVYASEVSPGAVASLRDAFFKKYGINLEFTLGRPTEVVAKMAAERRAGLFLSDVGHFGETSNAMDVKPMGFLLPLPDLLLLPEVTDPKNWSGGVMPYQDKERAILCFAANAIAHSIINTEKVNTTEIPSFLDMLKPRWKGKVVLSDPAISGPAPNLFADLAKTYGLDKTKEIMRQLVAQEPGITRDQRLLIEWVARDKYEIGLGYSGAILTQFLEAGAPVKRYSFTEPRRVNGGVSYITYHDKGPHPKAAQLYVNWLLTRETAALWTKTMEFASVRADVSREGLDPDSLPRPGDIYPDAELFQLRTDMRKIGADIFAPLMK